MSNETVKSSGIGFFVGLLTVLFIALKLTNVIGWSWWWVLSPIWIEIAILIIIVVVSFIWAAIRTYK